MYKATVYVDHNRLKDFQFLNKKYAGDNKENGISVYLETWTEEKYLHFYNNFKSFLAETQNTYNLLDHFNELLYLAIENYELIFGAHDYYQEEYCAQLETIEVAKILLAYMEYINHKQERREKDLTVKIPLSLSIKFPGFDTETQNRFLIESILKNFYNSIENGDCYFYHISPATFLENISGKEVMSLDKVRKIASMKPKKPVNKLTKKYLVKFSISIKAYLHNQTDLKTPIGKKLGNLQAKFLYDLLVVLDLINDDEINTFPEDYMHALFSKYT